MKKAKLVQAFFTQEEIAAINTKNIKLEEENEKLKAELEKKELTKEQAKAITKRLVEDLDSWVNLDCLSEPSYDWDWTLYDELIAIFSDFIYDEVNKCLTEKKEQN